ncbi:hypothetical protein [Amycolatopsis sp. WGS_07]|uniref:hypothetical protein n=1 Tax=Amycolatopsis sp. WGS_07 TaxID=3076764 RepID=UPI0038734033
MTARSVLDVGTNIDTHEPPDNVGTGMEIRRIHDQHQCARLRPEPITPHAEPTRRERSDDGRSIIARWNIGLPDSEGRQRQARFEVLYRKAVGYQAQLTHTSTTNAPQRGNPPLRTNHAREHHGAHVGSRSTAFFPR